MTVITGIIQAARIGYIAYRVGKVLYKGSLRTKRGAQWLGRHPKIARYGTVAASSAPIIYDLLNIDYSAIQKQIPKSYPVRKTRNSMVKFGSRRRNYNYCKPRYRRTAKRY